MKPYLIDLQNSSNFIFETENVYLLFLDLIALSFVIQH